MTYTISQVAEKMGVTVPTLHYYDKEGLLPFVDKKPDGTRVFMRQQLSLALRQSIIKAKSTSKASG